MNSTYIANYLSLGELMIRMPICVVHCYRFACSTMYLDILTYLPTYIC